MLTTAAVANLDQEERQERSHTGASTLASASCDDHDCKVGLNRRTIVAVLTIIVGALTGVGFVQAAAT